jgi:hypothetical protein
VKKAIAERLALGVRSRPERSSQALRRAALGIADDTGALSVPAPQNVGEVERERGAALGAHVEWIPVAATQQVDEVRIFVVSQDL